VRSIFPDKELDPFIGTVDYRREIARAYEIIDADVDDAAALVIDHDDTERMLSYSSGSSTAEDYLSD
jgi:hypothetical protein